MAHSGRVVLAVAGAICLTTTIVAAQDFEIVDNSSALEGVQCPKVSPCAPTMRQGVHACPPGRYVTGVFNKTTWGVFLCALLPPGYDPGSEHLDTAPGTQFVDPPYKMHACPKGSVISGISAPSNELLCVPSPLDPNGNDPNVVRFVDDGKDEEQGGVQRAGTFVNDERGTSPRIHACPPGLAMAGIQWSLNQILCEIRLPAALPRRPGVLRENR
jgi:hypothetical protein